MRSFFGAISRVDRTRADSFRLSVSKNGVTQMFIIAAARRGKNVGGILLLLAPAAGTVCINLNGNCGDVSRLARLPPCLLSVLPLVRRAPRTPFRAFPVPSFCLSSFLNNSPLLAVCYPEELSLFPAVCTAYFRLVPS